MKPAYENSNNTWRKWYSDKIKFYESLELREIPYYLGKIESKIYNLIKHNEENNVTKLRKLRYRRNKLRRILLNKLRYWIKNIKAEPELTYSKIMEIEEDNKYGEENQRFYGNNR